MPKPSEISKFMKKQEALAKAKALEEQKQKEALESKNVSESVMPKNLGRTTNLVFFRQ